MCQHSVLSADTVMYGHIVTRLRDDRIRDLQHRKHPGGSQEIAHGNGGAALSSHLGGGAVGLAAGQGAASNTGGVRAAKGLVVEPERTYEVRVPFVGHPVPQRLALV